MKEWKDEYSITIRDMMTDVQVIIYVNGTSWSCVYIVALPTHE